MSTRDTPPPCAGLRCPNPETCTEHTFRHPDQSVNHLHADDWFIDVTDPESWEQATAVTTQEEAVARLGQAMWACRLDCPIRVQCLAQGFDEQYGVRGGYTAGQRRAVRREQERRKREAGAAGQ